MYKRYLRDGADLSASREALREELRDLLWYTTAAVATESGLDLAEVAEANPCRQCALIDQSTSSPGD